MLLSASDPALSEGVEVGSCGAIERVGSGVAAAVGSGCDAWIVGGCSLGGWLLSVAGGEEQEIKNSRRTMIVNGFIVSFPLVVKLGVILSINPHPELTDLLF